MVKDLVKVLGHQIVHFDKIKEFNEIENACKTHGERFMAFFLYGRIIGIQEERARKKAKGVAYNG